MNLLEAVARWYACPYPKQRCKSNCDNYLLIDPRTDRDKDAGPGTKGKRTLCAFLDDLNDQIMKRTSDPRLEE